MVGICMLKMYIKSVCKVLEFVVKSYLVQGIFGSELKIMYRKILERFNYDTMLLHLLENILFSEN